MRQAFERMFLDHPKTVNETYLEHAGVASGFGLRLIGAGCAALAHAILPCLFETTASRAVKAMHAEMICRGSKSQADKAIGQASESKSLTQG